MRGYCRRVVVYGHSRTSLDECKCRSGYFLVNSTGDPTCKDCPPGVECLGGLSEDPMPAARPLHYLHSSTSNALIATRCKVDRGQVCLGSNIICTSNEYASAVGEHILYT